MNPSSRPQTHDHSRKRSRSPREPSSNSRHVKRHRSRSPHRHHHTHHHHTNAPSPKPAPKPPHLPFRAPHLHKHDLPPYTPLLASYLDIQKSISIADLSEDEVKGRWKSFLGKWNRRELAEGWYDPEMRGRVEGRYVAPAARSSAGVKAAGEPGVDGGAAREGRARQDQIDDDEDEDEDDDGYGPSLPSLPSTSTAQPHPTKPPAGPSAPSLQDLQLRREAAAETHQTHLATLRQTRKSDRALANSRLEELVPRADPGSHERRMEKRAETSAAHNGFRDAKENGGPGGGGGGEGGQEGVGDLLGDGDEAGSHQAEVAKLERKKGERELRKEEVLRARAAEREERVAEVRRKEERTMEMLRGIARERFG
ncbi:hypothetical protein LTR91_017959 [Friedmanniomyces endolithicus]|uniref:Uncharacterized protein n=1 Tax=Friedmanniomyces endolithicus TaxID=329885 RepID=A0AAN6K4V8_9PEZI|nr:hypothetical protein LTR59_008958 [Friedmanniomyces endolithicus]KAK0797494.1 hypothetical protein LTR38_008197 [Friedmanniomyces endolithicus]KAK0839314.1 hypothetical protein LTR03_011389 [Friedmanniomyces endolithicus]KAK0863449.1 hypothetical protein LTR87_016195 [Friedmanniomyces endolithicus]KAK0886738.1 hypothetical protein LTR02_017865 [Friedmanniomyces endolithicus]